MADILIEKVTNRNGVSWIRTHAAEVEFLALCNHNIHSESENVRIGEGAITCPDCIEVIRKVHCIQESDLQPEYNNELFSKRTSPQR